MIIPLDIAKTRHCIEHHWEHSVLPTLIDYIRIPNKPPAFDPHWHEHGYMEEALVLIRQWCDARPVQGLSMEIVRLLGRTPLLYLEIDATDPDASQIPSVLLYGHLDKQPEMEGWRANLGPWSPMLEDDKLYGRRGAHDGYAVFACLGAILALQHQGVAHPCCVILIEACEESGSYDLPPYTDHLATRIDRRRLGRSRFGTVA